MTALVDTSRRRRLAGTTARARRKGRAPHALSMKEIERRYADEWVLIVDPVVDALTRVRRGTVVYHSKDRDAVDRVALERRDPHIALLFIGKPPADLVAIL